MLRAYQQNKTRSPETDSPHHRAEEPRKNLHVGIGSPTCGKLQTINMRSHERVGLRAVGESHPKHQHHSHTQQDAEVAAEEAIEDVRLLGPQNESTGKVPGA